MHCAIFVLSFTETSECVFSDLCSQVVSGGQVLEPEQAVPVACATPTRIMLHNLVPRNKQGDILKCAQN